MSGELTLEMMDRLMERLEETRPEKTRVVFPEGRRKGIKRLWPEATTLEDGTMIQGDLIIHFTDFLDGELGIKLPW